MNLCFRVASIPSSEGEIDVVLFNAKWANFHLFHGKKKKKNWREDDYFHFVPDFYSASSMKQQSAGRHMGPLRHIILIPSQPVFALTP